jgi:pyruvate dehydrogenase E2 component (dihydrolipoyllysine-residue acetyltransferase)
MAISVVMPALEMAQETGKLLAWRKKDGEQVSKGEPLLEIETDKAVVEVEAPGDGVLAGICANVGDQIPVGQTIAWLVKPGEQPPSPEQPKYASARASSAPSHTVPVATQASAAEPVTAPQISPKARRLAKELGVDFTAIRGTGPDGVITSEDVQAFADGKLATPAAAIPAAESLGPIARLMAERTTQSWTQVPHFFVSRDVDCTELLNAQQRLAPEIEKAHGVRLSLTDLLVALVARVLVRHPRMNAMWKNGTIQFNQNINISVAMAVQDGVVSAVIHDAPRTRLADICIQRQELTGLARANRLRPADITGGTFTISNLGMYGVGSFTAIIPPSQAAILAVGGISDRVVAVEGQPSVRPMMTITLSSDHRIIDGARAAEFLKDLAGAIAEASKRLD